MECGFYFYRQRGRYIMKTLTLTSRFQDNTTSVENEFIDHFMAEANGEYVKVYLLLLRHLNQPSSPLSVSMLADILDNTEKDIIRALNYWAKMGLITITCDENNCICGISLEHVAALSDASRTPASGTVQAPSHVSAGVSMQAAAQEHTAHAQDLASVQIPGTPISGKSAAQKAPSQSSKQSQEELKQILFITEQYLGKTLTRTEVETIIYFYESLGFSTDLIEFLIEHCVDNGHKSIHYIQKVALAWYEANITTVDEARERTSVRNKTCYSILAAFGIIGRSPAAVELDYIRRWSEEYGFSLEMILEACNRTISAIHQPSFEYADSILKNWNEKNVRHPDDIEQADLLFRQEKEQKKSRPAAAKPMTSNRFNNFQGRSYDLDSLEQKLLNSN